MNSQFAYDKMDYYSVLEYLKEQAKYFSNGTWTDFSDADIGTVILKLMAMNTDTTNYQVEKGISELYIDTVVERANALALCKLIGYEPRHYESAIADLVIYNANNEITLPAFTQFTNGSKDMTFYNLEDFSIRPGNNSIKVFEGNYKYKKLSKTDISSDGTITLDEYDIGVNTIIVSQGGLSFTHIDNALYGESEACYSVHLNTDNQVYIQFPPYYSNFVTNAPIEVRYLISRGIEGRVGSNIVTGKMTINGATLNYSNPEASEGGFNPETVEEIRNEAPRFASTMNTVVTLNDFRILAKDFEGISDVVALDYNYPESGLKQPEEGIVNDAYKVNLYILPATSDSIYDIEGNTTDMVQRFMDEVKLKKPSSVMLNYYDVEYIRPHLMIKVYMDKYDLRYETTSNSIRTFLVNLYSRYNRKIGQAMYKSHISSEILENFDYLNYLEVISLEGETNGALRPNALQYIDLLYENITVQVVPYTEE